MELLEFAMNRLGLDGVSRRSETRAIPQVAQREEVDVAMVGEDECSLPSTAAPRSHVAEPVSAALIPHVEKPMPGPPRVAKPSLSARDFVFDTSPPDQGKCMARVWVIDKARPVFAQCSGLPSHDGFCSKHCTEKKRQAHGVWDPPSHASLSERKRGKGGKEAERRAARTWKSVLFL